MKITIVLTAQLGTWLCGASNLAITPAEDGSDYLWLSCLDHSDTGFIWRFRDGVC